MLHINFFTTAQGATTKEWSIDLQIDQYDNEGGKKYVH